MFTSLHHSDSRSCQNNIISAQYKKYLKNKVLSYLTKGFRF